MCNHQTEVYSRVVGYYRPVQQWNKGKQAEFVDRVPFEVGEKHRRNQATAADRAAALRASIAAIGPTYPEGEVG
jgi:ribonucleoside-triphosphate reductase (formate)